MGESTPRSNTRILRARSGGATRPPATAPVGRRRRKQTPSPSLGDEESSSTKPKTRSGGIPLPPATPAHPRSEPSSPGAIDEEESPAKRQKRSTAASKRTGQRKAKAARNILSEVQVQQVREIPPEPMSFERQLEMSWMALHHDQQLNTFSIGDVDRLDDDTHDEVCSVCREPDVLTLCKRCVHAVCTNCAEIDIECRRRWHCSMLGLHCTKRRQKRFESGNVVDQGDIIPKSRQQAKFKAGDFVEIPSALTPGFVRSRAWSPDYDSEAETPAYERQRPFFARVVASRRTEVEVEFLIYPDQTAIANLCENELLLTTTRYMVNRCAISGKASKPIVMSLDPGMQNGDWFLVRSRYDLFRRIRRPLLDHESPRTSPAEIIIDSRTPDSVTDHQLSHIEKAVQSLQLSSAPDVLPCRNKERAEIERILVSQLRVGGGGGGGLYISGLPGTGKTATVRRVIRGLRETRSLPDFKYVEINALKLQAPRYAYTELWKAISDQHCSPTRALAELQDYYRRARCRQRKQIIILVLDEFDYLVEAKTNNVIYNLFSFPTATKSGLIVVGIANTLDLPERIGGRVFSRLGLQCMNFEPYTAAQIEQIILERLTGLQNFIDRHAITLCAKSIASTSGDLRRALEIISTAVELCSADGGILTINHVTAARNQFSDTPAIQYIRSGAVHELGLLCAFLQELKQTERHEAEYDAVVRRLVRLLSIRGHQAAPSTVIDRIIHEMADKSLISLHQKRSSARPNLRLYINIEDVKFALQQTSFSDITL